MDGKHGRRSVCWAGNPKEHTLRISAVRVPARLYHDLMTELTNDKLQDSSAALFQSTCSLAPSDNPWSVAENGAIAGLGHGTEAKMNGGPLRP